MSLLQEDEIIEIANSSKENVVLLPESSSLKNNLKPKTLSSLPLSTVPKRYPSKINLQRENFNLLHRRKFQFFSKKTNKQKFPNFNQSPGLFSWFQTRISWSTPGFFLMNPWFSKFRFGSPD